MSMLINYSTTDLNSFLSKAEQKLAALGGILVQQVNWDEVEDSLLNKIELLTFILDEIDRTSDQEQIDKLVYFALDYYNLHEIPYSPFSIMSETVISSGSGGSGGSVDWSDITNKPATFPATPHTHLDEQINIALSGITETVGGITPGSFTGTLEQFLIQMLIKYQTPAFTSFSKSLSATYEIGQVIPINTDITFSWTISNPTNVKNISASGGIGTSEVGIFTSNLPFNLYGTTGIIRTFATNYTKNVPGALTFSVNGIASNDVNMNAPTSAITWYSRIWYGFDTDSTVTAMEIQGFQSVLTNSRQHSLPILGAGYKYIFIPDNISQTGIHFFDSGGTNIDGDMELPVNINVTNPQGVSLAGKLYRTTNFLGGAFTIVIN